MNKFTRKFLCQKKTSSYFCAFEIPLVLSRFFLFLLLYFHILMKSNAHDKIVSPLFVPHRYVTNCSSNFLYFYIELLLDTCIFSHSRVKLRHMDSLVYRVTFCFRFSEWIIIHSLWNFKIHYILTKFYYLDHWYLTSYWKSSLSYMLLNRKRTRVYLLPFINYYKRLLD